MLSQSTLILIHIAHILYSNLSQSTCQKLKHTYSSCTHRTIPTQTRSIAGCRCARSISRGWARWERREFSVRIVFKVAVSCTLSWGCPDLILGMGGALVSPDTLESDQKKLVGSGMMFEAESADALRKILEEDIYWTSNVVSNIPKLITAPPRN